MSQSGCHITGVHSFEPRYSYRAPTALPPLPVDVFGSGTLNVPQDQIYHCDVCVRCGKIVKPPTPDSSVSGSVQEGRE